VYVDDTIVAPATPPGRGAVAIVRLSGPRAFSIAETLWEPLRPENSRRLRRLTLGTIRDPSNGALLDRAMAVFFAAPRSLTGEDVVEFHCHGGIYLLRRVVGLTLDLGARMAEPGEFTRRAFLNGRIDLTAAEAIADLVDARTDRALAMALGQLTGALADRITAIRTALVTIRANLEVEIDFSDEDVTILSRLDLLDRLEAAIADVSVLRDSFIRGRMVRSGIHAALIGKPNVGKSSILNLMLGAERAIVTPIPGTTRDVIEETITIGGYPVVLQDTAGIRPTDDPVERIGVERSARHAAEAEILIAVFDSSRPLDDDDYAVAALTVDRCAIAVLNKSDLPAAADESELKRLRIGGDGPVVRLSALDGVGLEDLRSALSNRIETIGGSSSESGAADVAISRERHRAALERASLALEAARESARAGMPPEIIAIDVALACDWLGAITGEVSTENVLDALFREFCIGK
jgi:tRNA modification GTPase